MKKFRNGMPLKRHRRKVFLYEDSFTGKEAVDFLMTELPKFYSEEKEITRWFYSVCILFVILMDCSSRMFDIFCWRIFGS